MLLHVKWLADHARAWETGAHSDAVDLRRQSPARSRTSPRLRHTARSLPPQDIGRGGRVEGRTPREPRRHHLVVHDPAAPHGPAGWASGVRGRAGPLLPFLPSRAPVRAPRRDRRAGVLRAERVPHHRHPAPVPGAPRPGPGAGRIGAAALLHSPHPPDLPAVLLRARRSRGSARCRACGRASPGTRPISPTCTSFWSTRYTTKWGGGVSHLWSLAVEEQFYLLWPWVILFAPRRWLPGIALGAAAVGPVFRFVVVRHHRQRHHAGSAPRAASTPWRSGPTWP